MSKILNITPVKEGLSKEQAEGKIKEFLSNVLRDKLLRTEDIASNKEETFGGRKYTVLTLKDDSKWVIGDKGLERLVGSYYLGIELANVKLKHRWQAVETKYFLKYKDQLDRSITVNITKIEEAPLENVLTLHCTDIIACSRHAGNQKLRDNSYNINEIISDEGLILETIGYNDFVKHANLRAPEDDTIIIIDTEYSTFSSNDLSPISLEAKRELEGASFTFLLTEIIGQVKLGEESISE